MGNTICGKYVAIEILFLIILVSFLPIIRGTNGVTEIINNPQITEGFSPE